jgi:sugar lactone lactonase YvrE
MRHAYLLLGLACAACHALPTVGDGASLVLSPRLGGDRQLLNGTYVKADVDHLQVRLYQGATTVASVAVPRASLDHTVTFTNLRHATTYRVQADAYLDAGETRLISDPASSTVNVVLDANFHQPTLATIPVKLLDGTNDGVRAVGQGLDLTAALPAFHQRGVNFALAGNLATHSAGSTDGAGAAASFNLPAAIAIDAAGTTYVADQANHCIRKITPAGVVTTLAGNLATHLPGHADGLGPAAKFSYPEGVAVDAAGTVYVADTSNFCIRKITAAGNVTTLAGDINSPSSGGVVGVGATAKFFGPAGIAVDSAGTVYVADLFGHCIRKVDAGGFATTLAGDLTNPQAGSADGIGPAARFNTPAGVAVGPDGTVYVADTANHCIRKITPGSVVTTLAGDIGHPDPGSADGTGPAARFNSPRGIAVDAYGVVYVSDSGNNCIRKITPAGVVTTLAGDITSFQSGASSGTGPLARFTTPLGLAVDPNGNVYVAGNRDHCIRKIF